MEFINYAHRGAPSYAPENTLASFYLGWQMGANGVETDVQKTKDGVLVLFHDDTLNRILGIDGGIGDYSYEELLSFDFGIHKSMKFKGEKIPTFEEFLRHFGSKGLHFAIELKQSGIEKETLALIDRYCERDHVIVTSGIWQALVNMYNVDPTVRLGYLAKGLSDEMLVQARRDGFFQICPKADLLTVEWRDKIRTAGFSLRPWGIDCEKTMYNMLALQVDGMTINFPDVLSRAILHGEVR